MSWGLIQIRVSIPLTRRQITAANPPKSMVPDTGQSTVPFVVKVHMEFNDYQSYDDISGEINIQGVLTDASQDNYAQ